MYKSIVAASLKSFVVAGVCVMATGMVSGTPAPALAANAYDPRLRYRTLHSAHFAVHYPPGARNLGVRVMRLAEEVLQSDAALFGYQPAGQIEIVLTDQQDEANGSAQVIPKNILRLYLAAPTELTGLSSYDDWLRTLLTHELAHICDIDQTQGINRALRHVFGKWIMPNGYAPQFLSEGVAVFAETKLTSMGRGRSSYVEMLLRTAALDATFIRIDQANILYADWPGGNVAYYYGGRFHLYLAKRLGTRAVTELHRYHAGQLIPYIYAPGAFEIFGASLPRLWKDFHAEELAYAQEVKQAVQTQGVTASQQLTFHGRYILAARFSPDGRHIVYSRQSPVDGSTLRMMDADGTHDHFLGLDILSPRLSFSPDGSALYYSKAAMTHRFDAYNDLYHYDMARQRAHRLYDAEAPRRSLRAKDPALSPDGRTLVFVQNRLEQSYLSTATFDARDPHALHVSTLVGPVAEVQYASPAFSPDGNTLTVSVQFAAGQRDIVLLDAHTGAHLRRLTADQALEDNPTFSPDGRYVLYESDADGISNLYAFDLHSQRYYRITHVVGGAFQPQVSPDGSTLLFRNASGHGFDIHSMPYAPAAWQPYVYDPNTGYTACQQQPSYNLGQTLTAAADAAVASAADAAPTSARCGVEAAANAAWVEQGIGSSLPRALEPALTLNAHEHETSYTPWRTLLPLHNNWNLAPNVYVLNNDPFLSLSTFGQDALQYHTYQLSVGGSYYGRHPNVSLYYAYDGLEPTFSLALADGATTYQTARGRALLVSRQSTAAVLWPFRNRHTVALSYTFAHVSGNALAPLVSPVGTFGSVTLSYSYAFTHRFAYSVGSEHGRALSVSLTQYARALGSAYTQTLGSFDGRIYVNNPLFDNHVLALRLALNYAVGPDAIQNFFLYGTQGASVLTAQTGQLFPLRGFLPGIGPYGSPNPGTGLAAGYAEYRLPLWHIQRGLWTAPLYFQRLHAAVFVDAGTTFDRVVGAQGAVQVSLTEGLARLWMSTGAEVRLDVVFGWVAGLTLRGGIAVPTVVAGVPLREFHVVPYLDVGTAL